MNFNALENKISDRADKIVAKSATKFYTKIVKAWPVDTGASRQAWQISQKAEGEWEVSNNVRYSVYLWEGLPRGSSQMPTGGNPILESVKLDLQQDLRNIL